MSTLDQPTLFDASPLVVPSEIGGAQVRAVETLHLLTPGKGQTASYDFTLNPYRGCSFGCSYCYAAFFVADEAQRADWGKWVEVKVRAVESLQKKDLRDKKIYMSSVTDPYQPLEGRLGLTREIVRTLADKGARLVVQTRSPIAARDIDLFKRFRFLRVNMSVTTDDDAVRKRFEPSCASIERRLEAVEELCRAGIRVAVCVCPMLPMKDPEAFGRSLDRLGVEAVFASWFHASSRPFSASTREGAIDLAERAGWTWEAFSEAKAALKTGCAKYGLSSSAFGPV
jgi:DNA repair photolyase